MNFDLDERQQTIARQARDFLTQECPKSLIRELEQSNQGYSPELWRKMAELGWLSITVSEAHGGVGAGFADQMVLVEEMGRNIVPSPYMTCAALSGYLLDTLGTPEQRRRYLEPLIGGKLIISFAHLEPSVAYAPTTIHTKAVPSGNGYTLTGSKMFVPYAHVANYLLCVARTSGEASLAGGLTLFLVDAHAPGVRISVLSTIADDKQCEVTLDGVPVPRDAVLGNQGEAFPALSNALLRATALQCAEMVGGAQAAMDMALDYAKRRVQFGRPIGAFQSIQNYLAEMAVDVDRSRFATRMACWKIDQGLPAETEVSVAKAYLSDAYQQVTWQAHQIFASIAYYKEHDLQMYFRRARVQALAFGDARYHRAVLSRHLNLHQPPGKAAAGRAA